MSSSTPPTELDEVTPDEVGWKALRTFIDRHTAIALRYRPIFDVFQDAAETNVEVAAGRRASPTAISAIVRSKIPIVLPAPGPGPERDRRDAVDLRDPFAPDGAAPPTG